MGIEYQTSEKVYMPCTVVNVAEHIPLTCTIHSIHSIDLYHRCTISSLSSRRQQLSRQPSRLFLLSAGFWLSARSAVLRLLCFCQHGQVCSSSVKSARCSLSPLKHTQLNPSCQAHVLQVCSAIISQNCLSVKISLSASF